MAEIKLQDGAGSIPKGWAPFGDDPVEWDRPHAEWLEICLGVHKALENFDPRDPMYRRNSNAHGRPEPRHDWIFIREGAGLTQTQLGQLLRVGQPSIARWENGTRRPDNTRYLDWLTATAAEQATEARMQIYLLAALRDGWQNVDANPYQAGLWDAIFKPGGTYDRWKETGSLPAWRPNYVGLREVLSSQVLPSPPRGAFRQGP